MDYLRYLFFVVALGLGLVSLEPVEARSCNSALHVRWGFLGLDLNEKDAEAPRNVALISNPELYDASSWPHTSVPVVEHSVPGLWRPATPLPPDTLLESVGQSVITTEVIDAEAPSAIELLSVGDDQFRA